MRKNGITGKISWMKARFAALLILCIAKAPHGAVAQPEVVVDMQRTVKDGLRAGAAGANLCWLLDSDRRASGSILFSQAIEELKCGSLRFPYGHLADNYLWHTPAFENVATGLRPKVAAPTQAPAGWDWAVDKQGGFKSAMDFDEYMQLCDRLKIKPLVVVNVFSFKYEQGPTYETLKQTAVEWVRYAKMKNYNVAYWQIGNEVDHHQSLLPRDEYVRCYIDFVSAMKQVDPTINVGPGILNNTKYFDEIVDRAPDLIDFVSCHQYMYPYQKACGTYEGWKECNDRFIPSVDKMQKAVSDSPKPQMEIVVTETGVTPANGALGKTNNTYKALWWFEVLMNELLVKNVSYVYNWGTHSPWSGPEERENDVGVLLRVDNNQRKPTGEIIRIVNSGLLDRIMDAPRVAGHARIYATANASGSRLNLFLMNKNTEPEEIEIRLDNDLTPSRSFRSIIFSGSSPDDRSPTYTTKPAATVKDGKLRLQLPPLSLTLLLSPDPARQASPSPPAAKADGRIMNNKIWRDDRGDIIKANRGGHITRIDDRWYWVGNAAAGTKGNDIFMYSSESLGSDSWKCEGKMWDHNGFGGNCTLLPNPNNNTFVIIAKGLTFYVSDKLKGPYNKTDLRNQLRPEYNWGGMSAFQEGNKAYVVASRRLLEGGGDRHVGIYELNDSYTDLTREIFWDENQGREAMWIFKKDKTYYMTSSATHGWGASPSFYRTASRLAGPWSKEAKIRMVPKNDRSHRSQQRYIMNIGGDRWIYGGDRYPDEAPKLWDEDLGKHIICPVYWDGEVPVVYWREKWNISTYDWTDTSVDQIPPIPGSKE